MDMKNDENYDLAFIRDELKKSFSRIKVIDNSIDKSKIHNELLCYYEEKYSTFPTDHFSVDFIDLFCGAGGLSVGLEHEGFRPIMALDKDEASLKTYRFNRPWIDGSMLIQGDIRKMVKEDIFPHVPLIVGGPPCQGFSVVNKHKSGKGSTAGWGRLKSGAGWISLDYCSKTE